MHPYAPQDQDDEEQGGKHDLPGERGGCRKNRDTWEVNKLLWPNRTLPCTLEGRKRRSFLLTCTHWFSESMCPMPGSRVPENDIGGIMETRRVKQGSTGIQWFTTKAPEAGRDWRQGEKGTADDETVGWHHLFNGHEFVQTPGDGRGQGSLVCCSPRGHKKSQTWLSDWTTSG